MLPLLMILWTLNSVPDMPIIPVNLYAPNCEEIFVDQSDWDQDSNTRLDFLYGLVVGQSKCVSMLTGESFIWAGVQFAPEN